MPDVFPKTHSKTAGVTETLLEGNLRPDSLYFPQNTLMFSEHRWGYNHLYSMFSPRASRYCFCLNIILNIQNAVVFLVFSREYKFAITMWNHAVYSETTPTKAIQENSLRFDQ